MSKILSFCAIIFVSVLAGAQSSDQADKTAPNSEVKSSEEPTTQVPREEATPSETQRTESQTSQPNTQVSEPQSPRTVPPQEPPVVATSSAPEESQDRCGPMEVWDYSRWMCMPVAMPGMSMSMLMIHGNAFLAGNEAEGPRGGSTLASTNMLMIDYGKSAGDHHYLNAELMLTAERWTMPPAGYPEIGQVGDYDQDGNPFIDRQHPHSSPIMGMTFSDTISFSNTHNFVQLFFAPRGAATDGPVAFLHRPTGMVNPVAPLGHHVGQDSGHVTSTVLGAVLGLGNHRIEFSAFNGLEPLPTNVDLKMGPINSYAGRLTFELARSWDMMVSAAYIKNPDPFTPDIDHYSRYSISSYNTARLSDAWTFNNALIYGLIRNNHDMFATDGTETLTASCIGKLPPDVAASLPPGTKILYPNVSSVTEEFLFDSSSGPKIWGRAELLQRTPFDLGIFNDPRPMTARLISAWTIGYSHEIASWSGLGLEVGASITKTLFPSEFQPFYSGNPMSGAIFLRLHGMEMMHR